MIQSNLLPKYEVAVGPKVFDFYDVPLTRNEKGRWALSFQTAHKLMVDVAMEVLEMAGEKPLSTEEIAFVAKVKHMDGSDIQEIVDKSEIFGNPHEEMLRAEAISEFNINHKRERIKELKEELGQLQAEVKEYTRLKKEQSKDDKDERKLLLSHPNRSSGLSAADLQKILKQSNPTRKVILDEFFIKKTKRNFEKKYKDLGFWIRNGRLLFTQNGVN